MAEPKMSGIIQEGDMVILRKDKHLQSAGVLGNKKCNIDKMWFTMVGVIGQPYGTTFEVKGNHLVPIKKECEEETDQFADAEETSGKDNRNLLDKRANQKLSKEEIEGMRKEGTSGQVIVEQLIENSATFKNKTEFAQQKYIKKKKKKFLNRVTILRPSTRLIAEMYFNKRPTRICNLRMDSLAQILTYSNIQSGSRVLLVESCCGLLTGAIVERLGGSGMVMQLYSGYDPVWQAISCYNFSKESLSVLHKYPLKELAEVLKKTSNGEKSSSSEGQHHKKLKSDTEIVQQSDPSSSSSFESKAKTDIVPSKAQAEKECVSLPTSDSQSSEEQAMESEERDTEDKDVEIVGEEIITDDQSQDNTDIHKEDQQKKGLKRKLEKDNQEKEVERERKREDRQKQKEEAKQILEKGNFDGLIIACRHHPTPILINMMGFLATSRPFVIFSPYQQPLLDCYMKLRDRGGVANLRFTETWLRKYQVLSNRTHPHINMSNYSGYLLTGITTTFDCP